MYECAHIALPSEIYLKWWPQLPASVAATTPQPGVVDAVRMQNRPHSSLVGRITRQITGRSKKKTNYNVCSLTLREPPRPNGWGNIARTERLLPEPACEDPNIAR